MINSKYYQAQEDGIEVSMSFFLDLDKLNMNIYEFSKILGILLDNAIEAARDSKEKIINITFRREFNKHRDIVFAADPRKADEDKSGPQGRYHGKSHVRKSSARRKHKF